MVEESGMSLGCWLPAGVLVPGETRPTIALDGHRSAPDPAAPGASWIGRAAGQRAALPRNVAAGGTAAPRPGVQCRAAGAVATCLPAGVRRSGHEAARG